MRTITEDLTDLVEDPKVVGVRATFRRTLPRFLYQGKTDSLGLVEPAAIDSCEWSTGILRVVNSGNVLHIQFIADVHAAWPAWTNTGIALLAGSRPAVDAGNVFYQTTSAPNIRYRAYSAWGTEVAVRDMPGPMILAPLGTRCYGLWMRSGIMEIVSLNNGDSGRYNLYGPTFPNWLDVVSLNGKEYFYTMDRDAGRIIEIQHSGNAVTGKDSWGVGKAIVPIDAIDDVYGLKMGYANVINGKVVVTGKLTRTSDAAPISMDIYLIGPEHFSMGRDMFIQSSFNINGKMHLVDDELVVTGSQRLWYSDATNLFGYDHTDLKLQTSDLAAFTLSESEGRSSALGMELSTELDRDLIIRGNEVTLEMAYDNNWGTLGTYEIDAVSENTDTQGTALNINATGKTGKRLNQWSPEQGIYIPSQANMWSNPASLTHVIRSAGKWESTDPDNPLAPIRLKDLNKVGVLYSSARSGRGGAMRGRFFYPSDTYFKPSYGVVANYYMETAAEAAERLGVEVDTIDETMYGHNGILAAFAPTAHAGGPGVGLYLWTNNVFTVMTTASLSIPADTWHWLEIVFVEGEIRVKYCLAGATTWTEIISHTYAQTSRTPWKREDLGRGAIYMKNVTPNSTYYEFDSADNTLAVEDNGVFPSSGTLLIDSEKIDYNGKSTAVPPALVALQVQFSGRADIDPAFLGNRLKISALGNDYVTGAFDFVIDVAGFDGAYTGLACSFVTDRPWASIPLRGGRTFRITNYDYLGPRGWDNINNYYPSGWSWQKGNPAYGSWGGIPISGNLPYLFFDENVASYLGFNDEHPNTAPNSMCIIREALYLTVRGAHSTFKAAHSGGMVSLSRDKYVLCDVAGSFTQDEDQSIEDAMKTIAAISGGRATCQTLRDGSQVFGAAGVLAAYPGHKNCIVDFDIPTINDGVGVGFCFRSTVGITVSGGWPTSASGGYYLEINRTGTDYFLSLWNLNTHALIEKVPLWPTSLTGGQKPVPSGTIKISVQGGFFTVWLNGRYIHTFYNTTYLTGTQTAFGTRQAATFRVHFSELDDLLADIIAGTRGNGMSVLSEILADRHILFRDNQDGSMFFYKTRPYIGAVPDIVSSVQTTTTDGIISRLRAEGTQISEVYDYDFIRDNGNVFATINTRHANDHTEATTEALFLIDEQWRLSDTRKYSVVPYPLLQPGDAVWFEITEPLGTSRIIRSMTTSIGFNGDNFFSDMELEVMPAERE